MSSHLVLLRLGEMRAWEQWSYSARVFGVVQGQLPESCTWPYPLAPRRPWIPMFFSPTYPPYYKPLWMAARIVLCEKMTPFSGPTKSVLKLSPILLTSWLEPCTTLKCPEAKCILPFNSLAGAASKPFLLGEPLGLKSHFYLWIPLTLIVCGIHRTICGWMLK